MLHSVTGHHSKSIDMTQGVIWKQIVLFAVPLILGNVFQQLYNTVDSIVVGNFLGATALAAVGATTAICNTLVNFFNGISVGAGVVISSYFGSKDDRNLHEAVETTVMLAVLTGACVAVLSFGIVPGDAGSHVHAGRCDCAGKPVSAHLFYGGAGAVSV